MSAFPELVPVPEIKTFPIVITAIVTPIITKEVNYLVYGRKHPFRDVLKKRCSENTHQIYRSTPVSKCDFNKVAL